MLSCWLRLRALGFGVKTHQFLGNYEEPVSFLSVLLFAVRLTADKVRETPFADVLL